MWENELRKTRNETQSVGYKEGLSGLDNSIFFPYHDLISLPQENALKKIAKEPTFILISPSKTPPHVII
jgi:hypothetical protein